MVERGPGSNPEQARNPEVKLEPRFGVVVISGKPGAGTTSLAKRLATECGVPLYKAGDTVREMTGNVDRAPGFILRTEEIDRKVDERVARIVRNASIEKPFIAEAQIGAATTTQTQKATEGNSRRRQIEAPVIKVLLWARANVRYDRLYRDAQSRGENASFQTIRERTSQREREDLEHWKSMYPWIGNDNPLNMGARDADGEKISDLEFDNSDHSSADETYEQVIATLRRMGLVITKGQNPSSDN